MKRSGGTLNAYYQVKETNLKRLYMLYDSNLHNILEKAKLQWPRKIMAARGSGRQGEEWIDEAQGMFSAVKLFCMTL